MRYLSVLAYGSLLCLAQTSLAAYYGPGVEYLLRNATDGDVQIALDSSNMNIKPGTRLVGQMASNVTVNSITYKPLGKEENITCAIQDYMTGKSVKNPKTTKANVKTNSQLSSYINVRVYNLDNNTCLAIVFIDE